MQHCCRWKGCTKLFSDPEQLYSHLTNDHVGRKSTGNLCLTCHWEDCDVSVIKRDHITSHLRVHVPSKPHHCAYCDKSFKRPQDLKKHEKIHDENNDTLKPQTGGMNPSLSPQSSSMSHARLPISPPHSTTYSDDSWMQPVISPRSDVYDMRQEPCTPPQYNSNEFIQQLMFNEGELKTDYDTEMMNNLDMLQALVDNGSICPSSLNISSQEQLNNFNLWLSQLTEQIQSPYSEQQKQQQEQLQQHNQYADVLLQFNEPQDVIYPEQDLYVRSYPSIQSADLATQQVFNQQEQLQYDNQLYNDYPVMDNNYSQYSYTPDLKMNGQRHHYTAVPGMASNLFTPDIRTTCNLRSTKEDVKYKTPTTHAKEEKVAEAFKPTIVTHETKKNVTTMMNVFSSTLSVNDKKVMQTKEETAEPSAKKTSSVSKDVLDLLVSDMSDLSIEKKKESSILYPSLDKIEKHQKLLRQLSEWANTSFKQKDQLRV
ncbi:hypothetical protein G6F70_004509 [Rhizopus microsporus]|uniref:C2H2-type domain-containing protein n=1 Tax=Rhizopus microsporus TaxID=58291 RepID=A0A1X0RUA3_RHIZD|nr:hypothetical protein G6F71_004588 [Rhizopus microsporus]KAG1199905.1 hypothetical protein G6F70_004509 [Rhizopus microsporus]KAG1211601.1 hypothetical protein G6F69_004452 [Rhizopus microsporus]KAG1233311.1 hypothetical protein G6F67_004367 [Rhizopus microsporus]KAG1265353.1 hypothetical protein G6F68_003650 [Rhizopus microsporus]